MNDHYAELITTFPLFNGFTANGTKRLVDAGTIREIAPGHVVLNEGEPADVVLLVLTGTLEVFVVRDGREIVLTGANPGAIIGELAVLCEAPRAASVRAREAAVVLEWSGEAFRTLLLRDHALSQRIFGQALRLLVEKERELIDALMKAQG